VYAFVCQYVCLDVCVCACGVCVCVSICVCVCERVWLLVCANGREEGFFVLTCMCVSVLMCVQVCYVWICGYVCVYECTFLRVCDHLSLCVCQYVSVMFA